MWRDDDDRIMDILDSIITKNRKCFPVFCPVCGRKEGHIYFHRYKAGDESGGMWIWCSACCHCVHALYRLPKWWKNLEGIDYDKLTSYPDYLEENKICIDEWINKILIC